jgi:hypothetical protein
MPAESAYTTGRDVPSGTLVRQRENQGGTQDHAEIATHGRSIRNSLHAVRRRGQLAEQAERLVNAEDLGRIADLGAIEADTLIVNGSADPIVDASVNEPGLKHHLIREPLSRQELRRRLSPLRHPSCGPATGCPLSL